MAKPRARVAAYVIRHRPDPELLVFDHIGMPEAGTQVPAGGIESGEGPEEAVLREIAEETGLLTATAVRQIAVENRAHPDTGQPRRARFVHLQAPADTADEWEHHVLGEGDDAGLAFACRYLPLPSKQPLADGQDAGGGSGRKGQGRWCAAPRGRGWRPGTPACRGRRPARLVWAVRADRAARAPARSS
ncbi:NUDIX domain-containing protein [Streptomyces sp. NPDC048590]|uniref:NUDIX hydrolase n=1 Tax=Streptomyces sp. NPDC048590 TaxID=3365574 RepID=UPI00371C53CB